MTEEVSGEQQVQVQDAPQEPKGPAAGGDKAGAVAETTPEEATVPVSVIRALRDENKATKDQLNLAMAQLQMLRAQSPQGTVQPMQQAAQPQGRPAQSDPFDGLADDDLPTVADLRRAMEALQQTPGHAVAQIRAELTPQLLALKDPNYEQTIRDGLLPVIQTPEGALLVQAIQNSPDPLKSAYAFATMLTPKKAADPAAQSGGQLSPADQIEQILSNLSKPRPASAVSGAGGALSAADRFRTMSDEEIDAYKAKVLSGQL